MLRFDGECGCAPTTGGISTTGEEVNAGEMSAALRGASMIAHKHLECAAQRASQYRAVSSALRAATRLRSFEHAGWYSACISSDRSR